MTHRERVTEPNIEKKLMRAMGRRRPRDVDVNPWSLTNKLTKEECRCDAPAPPIGSVFEVGIVTLQSVAKLVKEWHVPHRLACG